MLKFLSKALIIQLGDFVTGGRPDIDPNQP